MAKRQVDFFAGAPTEVIERGAEGAGGGFLVHAERQRRVVRQRRGEVRRVGTAHRRQLLREAGHGTAGDHQQNGSKRSHDAAFCIALSSSPSRNGSTASIKACGWSMLTACPAAGTTTFCAPGIFAAM